MESPISPHPGIIVLLGSGETLPSSRPIHEYVFRRLPVEPRIAILETPAGFEPNSSQVAGRIESFLSHRMQNYAPEIRVIPARKKETTFSPDDPDLVGPLLEADEILLGPGSPTYAVRQLQDSLALQMITARHFLGAVLFLSSAATLAFGLQTMPVYEIYKVGLDLHWQAGLDYFAPFGWRPILIPHWNNNDGGDELDTSRCYIGRNRFEQLCDLLEPQQLIVGIDEHTALILEPDMGTGLVLGQGTVTIRQGQGEDLLTAGTTFPLSRLGTWSVPELPPGVSPPVWRAALEAGRRITLAVGPPRRPPAEILALADQRTQARSAGNWPAADQLRDQIAALGWQVIDTPDGTELEPL